MIAVDWRAGDTVHHGPTGEDWTVAYVDGDRLAWVGWPPGDAMVSDCTMVERASDEEHMRMLHALAEIRGDRYADERGIKARAALEAKEDR